VRLDPRAPLGVLARCRFRHGRCKSTPNSMPGSRPRATSDGWSASATWFRGP